VEVFKTIHSLKLGLKNIKDIGFVPTMGNLHKGHLKLIQEAQKQNLNVIISIYVNALQFNDPDDLKNYPRTLHEDLAAIKSVCEDAIVFCPDAKDVNSTMRPLDYDLGLLGSELCGASRLGHFDGVIKIINFFFDLIKPDAIFLGKKDYQQLVLIEQFTNKFYPKIKIYPVEIQRDQNNLALSSRNTHINDKVGASFLYQTLYKASQNIQKQNEIEPMLEQCRSLLNQNKWKLDYVEIRESKTLDRLSAKSINLIILGAAFYENIRLIDNIEFCIE
jgi:pantoate--beta-alanine ligase